MMRIEERRYAETARDYALRILKNNIIAMELEPGAMVSAIMWGSIVSVYMTLLMLGGWNVWRLFLLGIPGQAAILLWFRLFCAVKKEEQNG